MSEEKGQQKKQRFSREDIIKHKVSLAQDVNTQVVRAATSDTRTAILMLTQGDRVMETMRRGLGMKYDAAICIPMIERYKHALTELNDVIKEVSNLVGWRYKEPSVLKRVEKTAEKVEKAAPKA